MVIVVAQLSQECWENVVWKLFLKWMPNHWSKWIKVFKRDGGRAVIQWSQNSLSDWFKIRQGRERIPAQSTLTKISLCQGWTFLLKKELAALWAGKGRSDYYFYCEKALVGYYAATIWNYLEKKTGLLWCSVHIWQSLNRKYLEIESLWRERVDQFSGCRHDFCWEGLKIYFSLREELSKSEPRFLLSHIASSILSYCVSLGKWSLEVCNRNFCNLYHFWVISLSWNSVALVLYIVKMRSYSGRQVNVLILFCLFRRLVCLL